MGGVLVGAVLRFQLERGVLNAQLEAVGDTSVQFSEHRGGVTVVEALLRQYDVRAEGWQPGRDL